MNLCQRQISPSIQMNSTQVHLMTICGNLQMHLTCVSIAAISHGLLAVAQGGAQCVANTLLHFPYVRRPPAQCETPLCLVRMWGRDDARTVCHRLRHAWYHALAKCSCSACGASCVHVVPTACTSAMLRLACPSFRQLRAGCIAQWIPLKAWSPADLQRDFQRPSSGASCLPRGQCVRVA